jgi:hypothetical protein
LHISAQTIITQGSTSIGFLFGARFEGLCGRLETSPSCAVQASYPWQRYAVFWDMEFEYISLLLEFLTVKSKE